MGGFGWVGAESEWALGSGSVWVGNSISSVFWVGHGLHIFLEIPVSGQNRWFYVASGIISTAGQNQK